MAHERKTDKIPEVTPEMIEAGEAAYYAGERYIDDDPINGRILEAIYRAMHRAEVPRFGSSHRVTKRNGNSESARR